MGRLTFSTLWNDSLVSEVVLVIQGNPKTCKIGTLFSWKNILKKGVGVGGLIGGVMGVRVTGTSVTILELFQMDICSELFFAAILSSSFCLDFFSLTPNLFLPCLEVF